MENEKGYIESVMEHIQSPNHRRGIHIWMDVNDDESGLEISMNHNFNDDEGNEELEDVIQLLDDVMKSVKLRAMGSEHPEIAEFMRFMASLENGGNENE